MLLGGALVATYVLFAAASMRIALRAREVQVPNLANRTANDATAAAADLGLTLKVDETRRPDPKIAPGRVVAQDPPRGIGRTAAAQRQGLAELSANGPPRFPRWPANPNGPRVCGSRRAG